MPPVEVDGPPRRGVLPVAGHEPVADRGGELVEPGKPVDQVDIGPQGEPHDTGRTTRAELRGCRENVAWWKWRSSGLGGGCVIDLNS